MDGVFNVLEQGRVGTWHQHVDSAENVTTFKWAARTVGELFVYLFIDPRSHDDQDKTTEADDRRKTGRA